MFLERLAQKKDEFLDQVEMRKNGMLPTFTKKDNMDTLVFKEVRYLYIIPRLLEMIDDIKVVMIKRDPIAVLNSWVNAPKEFDSQWDINEEWYFATKKNRYMPENYYGYGKWKEAMAMFIEMVTLYPNKAILTEYEELNKNTIGETKRLFEFCNIDYTENTELFIEASHRNTIENAYSVYRKDGFVKKEQMLPERIKELIINDISWNGWLR